MAKSIFRIAVLLFLLLKVVGLSGQCLVKPSKESIRQRNSPNSTFQKNLSQVKKASPDRVRKALRLSDLSSSNKNKRLIAIDRVIPIHAVIIRKSDGTGGISTNDIMNCIFNANQTFDRMNVSFQLCKTTYVDDDAHANHLFSYYENPDRITSTDLINYDVDNALNIFFVPKANASWSNFPSGTYDHIMMKNTHCDLSLPNSKGIFMHEIGHWLGLYHTFETANGVEMVNGSNCGIAGDLICDTPADSRNLITSSHCNIVAPSSLTDANGDQYSPMINNIMSYYQSCLQKFTPEQEAIMQTHLLTTRSGYVNSCSDIDFTIDFTVNYSIYGHWICDRSGQLGQMNSDGPTEYFPIEDTYTRWDMAEVEFELRPNNIFIIYRTIDGVKQAYSGVYGNVSDNSGHDFVFSVPAQAGFDKAYSGYIDYSNVTETKVDMRIEVPQDGNIYQIKMNRL